MADWPTRPKDGAPATIDVSVEAATAILSPIPINWLLPLAALFDPITITTADLCSSPPPAAESWTLADLINTAGPARPFLVDKLVRMVQASVWPTYCEFYPPEDLPTLPTGQAVYSANFTFAIGSAGTWGDGQIIPSAFEPGDHSTGSQFDRSMTFYLLYLQCIEPHTTGDPVSFHLVDAAGGNLFNVATTEVPYALDDRRLYMFLTKNFTDLLPAGDVYWDIHLPTDGQYEYLLMGWQLNAPETPEPWPAAPPSPDSIWTQECVDALCLMGTQWPEVRVGSLLVNGQLVELHNMVAALPSGPTTPPEPVTGGNSYLAPPNAVGLSVELSNIPPGISTSGDSPVTYWDVGYVTFVTQHGEYPGIRITRDVQVFRPLPPGVIAVLLDVLEPIIATPTWLVTPA